MLRGSFLVRDMTEQELANVIWDIKEIIRNLYDDAEVENVILPFTLLRRLDCVLDPHRKEIMDKVNQFHEEKRRFILEAEMRRHSLTFFNTSGLSLERMLGVPEQIGQSFATYLDGFTSNVKDILANFVRETTDTTEVDLSKIYSHLDRHNKLFSIVQLFVQRTDLHPDKVSNEMMGKVFEIVIRRAKEASNTKAGQFYTPREIVRLLAALTLQGRESELHKAGQSFSIYDPCCGTGGMLTVGKEYLIELSGNPNLPVFLYGQELNEKTYAICKADLLMKGEGAELDSRLHHGNTLTNDKLVGHTFRYMLANPPFGVDWGKDEYVKNRVLAEECAGGRFWAGTPDKSDGSLLFLQHMISKMDSERGSRIGIVLNGSPLFNGSPGSGWSNIRKSFLDDNLLDCIVALPKSLFYGTDIGTYLWILDNKRPEERRGKVLFINAVHAEYTKLLQKNLGKKRFEISPEGIADILKIYADYHPVTREIVYPRTGEKETLEVAKLLDYNEFFCTQVAVRRPKRMWYENITARWEELCAQDGFNPDDKKFEVILPALNLDGIDKRRGDTEFFAWLKANKQKTRVADITLWRNLFGRISEDAPEVREKPFDPKSPFEADSALNDSEYIPFTENIDEYFAREVLPHTPDAWMDRTKDRIGVEFPFTRLFYIYRPLRSPKEILSDFKDLNSEVDEKVSYLISAKE